MPAPKIIIIRHGEKPIKKVKGVDYNSAKDNNSLIVKGWTRAGALPHILTGSLTPKYIHACYKSDHAQRAYDTVRPLAVYLGLDIDTSIKKGKEAKMALVATEYDDTVVIAWEHDAIHAIGNSIVGNNTIVPQVWPEDRFDIMYVFTLGSDGKYTFSQIPQMAIAGDQVSIIPN